MSNAVEGLRESELQDMIFDLDRDGDRKIDYEGKNKQTNKKEIK